MTGSWPSFFNLVAKIAVSMLSYRPFWLLITSLLLLSVSVVAQHGEEPPKIYAKGDQFYCPGSEIHIVQEFDVLNPDKSEISNFYIQISAGYVQGTDRLRLASQHENIQGDWEPVTGKLRLWNPLGGLLAYDDLLAAVKEVVFSSSDPDFSGEKFFSLTAGDANFLPSTGHYYQFKSSVGITWKEARDQAEGMDYNGLKGYLATIRSLEEAVLAGEQAGGAGWIGGSDEVSEGRWEWVTGPDKGVLFWIQPNNGNGYAPNGEFSYWNEGEPNDLQGEDYAHVMVPVNGRKGLWNDLSNTGAASGDYQPKGFIVEYGYNAPEDAEDFAAYTRIYTPSIDKVLPGSNCGPGKVRLEAMAKAMDTLPSPVKIYWFDSAESMDTIFSGNIYEPYLTESRDYYVLPSDGSCTQGKRSPISASIYQIPVVQTEVTLQNCDVDDQPNDGYTEFNLEAANELINTSEQNLAISYYYSEAEAREGLDSIEPALINNQTTDRVYARAKNSSGCFETATVNLVATATDPVEVVVLESCDLDQDNDGLFTFDLTKATQLILESLPPQNLLILYYRTEDDAIFRRNPIEEEEAYKNEVALEQMLYIRVESKDNLNCMHLGPYVKLKVNLLPEFGLRPEAIYCLNLDPIQLEVENPQGQYSYVWTDENEQVIGTDPSIEVSSGGRYTVRAYSDLNCESLPRIVTVSESDLAQLSSDDILVTDGGEVNSIEILTDNLGEGNYEFALDNQYGPYQNEPFFNNVEPGIHWVYAQDKNGCGVTGVEVSVIGYPKFFTPNGDGYNDTWQVKGISFQPGSEIYIYDRFGKLLDQIDPRGEGWNGFYRGKQLPSSDYWYIVRLDDGRVHRGHFSLIIR